MIVNPRSKAAIHRFVRRRHCKSRGIAGQSSRSAGRCKTSGSQVPQARLELHDAARHRLARRSAPGVPGRRRARLTGQALARPAGSRGAAQGARHRAAPPAAGAAGAGAGGPRCRVDAVAEFLDPTIPQAVAGPVHGDGDGGPPQADRGRDRRGEKVAIFGDYDVDGATSAAVLAWICAIGLDPLIHIPDRIFEGYGPNTEAVRALAEKAPRCSSRSIAAPPASSRSLKRSRSAWPWS